MHSLLAQQATSSAANLALVEQLAAAEAALQVRHQHLTVDAAPHWLYCMHARTYTAKDMVPHYFGPTHIYAHACMPVIRSGPNNTDVLL